MIETGRGLEGGMSLITGAGFGIGREMVHVPILEGRSLVLADRYGKTVMSLAAKVEAAGGRAMARWLASNCASCSSGAAFGANGVCMLRDNLGADRRPERLVIVP